MSVVLPDGSAYELRRKTETLDASRYPVAGYNVAADWTGEGASQVQRDRTYAVRLDTSAWPAAYDDLVTTPAGLELLVRTAQIVPQNDDGAFDDVRHVAITAEPRHQRQLPREEQGAAAG